MFFNDNYYEMNPMDQYNYNNGYGYYDQYNNSYSYGYDCNYNNNLINNDYSYNNNLLNNDYYNNYNNYNYNSITDYTPKYETNYLNTYTTPTYTPIDTNSWSYNYTNYDNYLNKNEITPIGSTGNSHFGYVKSEDSWHVSTPLPGFGKKEGLDNGFTWHDNITDFKW